MPQLDARVKSLPGVGPTSGRYGMRRMMALAAVLLMLVGGSTAVAADVRAGAVEIRTLSNRADLVSGGEVLVEIRLPAGTTVDGTRVAVGGRDVTSSFATRDDGRFYGLVTDLPVGRSTIVATTPKGTGARLTVTNHPATGPVFAGPQVTPWVCTTEENGLGAPADAGCAAKPLVSYVYKPEGGGDFQPYDPASPPGDVATTETDQGHRVPYIVRVETGSLDRGIYKMAVLADPDLPWTPWQRQKGWNGKLHIPFGGGCGTPHVQTAPESIMNDFLLSRGFMSASSGLNVYAQNCNEVVSAEVVMMMKEHIAETFGPIRYTIGEGCSGGSIQVHNIAGAYPGLLDGILPSCSFPDAWQVITDAVDCYLLQNYFTLKAPYLWPASMQAEVMDKATPLVCAEWTALFNDDTDPQNRGPFQIGISPIRGGCQLPAEQTYHPQTNPKGVRCSIQDYQGAIWGYRPSDGFARLPLDNEGVQYGLEALNSGAILPAQFLDLNRQIGGLDIDANFSASRTVMDDVTAQIMYRAGRHTDPSVLAETVILDARNWARDGDNHQPYTSWVMRARLDKVNGHHDNQAIWTFPGPPLTNAHQLWGDALLAIDSWLTNVETDKRDVSKALKVRQAKPAEVVDTCWIGTEPVTDQARCAQAYPYDGDPRTGAGGPFASDVRKCRLKPLDPADYGVPFSAAEWDGLQAAFPNGVCDWTVPGVGQQRSVRWMTYASARGGTPLGAAPRSVPFGPARTGQAAGPVSQKGALPATGLGHQDALAATTVGLVLVAAWTRRRSAQNRCAPRRLMPELSIGRRRPKASGGH